MSNRNPFKSLGSGASLLRSRLGSRSEVVSDIRSAGLFILDTPRHRTLDVYGHPHYRMRRVA
jgi:hypothetical protein